VVAHDPVAQHGDLVDRRGEELTVDNAGVGRAVRAAIDERIAQAATSPASA
jgi:hypothetical protein